MKPAETVRAYYPRVDAGDVEWVIGLFSEDGIYQRAEATYSGRAQIADFYTNDRKIEGRHSVENVITDANTVVAYGVFEGVGADGATKNVGFADIWEFGSDGFVHCRKTYLALGSDYVKD